MVEGEPSRFQVVKPINVMFAKTDVIVCFVFFDNADATTRCSVCFSHADCVTNVVHDADGFGISRYCRHASVRGWLFFRSMFVARKGAYVRPTELPLVPRIQLALDLRRV